MNQFPHTFCTLILLGYSLYSLQICVNDTFTVYKGDKFDSSGTGYRYGLIRTPHFPAKFQVPFKRSHIVDAFEENEEGETRINVYLTQMHLTRGVKFYERGSLCHSDGNGIGVKPKCPDERKEIPFSTELHDVRIVTTKCPYLEIEVDVPYLYGNYHYRTGNPGTFHDFGFNITYEIVPSTMETKTDSCSSRNCSDAGQCYLSGDWR